MPAVSELSTLYPHLAVVLPHFYLNPSEFQERQLSVKYMFPCPLHGVVLPFCDSQGQLPLLLWKLLFYFIYFKRFSIVVVSDGGGGVCMTIEAKRGHRIS